MKKKSPLPVKKFEDALRANHEPIYLTSSFYFENAQDAFDHFVNEKPGYLYSRFTNPNLDFLESHIAQMEHGKWCVSTSSGMAASLTLFLSALKAGDHIVCALNVFGSTIAQIKRVLIPMNVTCTFVHSVDLSAWEQAIQPNTKLFFCETPSNPLCEIVDITALSGLAHAHGILLAIDNCLASPVSQNPLLWGADVVLHSATKHIDGHGRCLGGLIVGNDEQLHQSIRQFMRCSGPSLSPFNAWLLMDGLRTLNIRMKQECHTAGLLADWLSSHSAIDRVYYPGLTTHTGHELAKKQQHFFGSIVSFRVKKNTRQAAWKVMDALQHFSITANLGDVKSSVTHPATTTHGRLSDAERERAGVAENLIRISIGLEEADVLQADLERGLKG